MSIRTMIQDKNEQSSLGRYIFYRLWPQCLLARFELTCSMAQAPVQEKKLDGKVALITGAARGLGATTASLFARHGAHVFVADILDEIGTAFAEEIGATFVHCDVTQESDVAAAVELAVSKHGRIDIMYNNAGIVHAGNPLQCYTPITDIDVSVFDSICNVNIKGSFLGTKHAAQAMIKNGTRGCILNTCSIAGVVAHGTYHAYTVSKHAVLGLTKTAASELGKNGIRVNCVSPSGVLTPMAVDAFAAMGPKMTTEEINQRYVRNSDLQGSRLEVEDIANAALFLCSSDAKYISGHNLVVDGGFCAFKVPSLDK